MVRQVILLALFLGLASGMDDDEASKEWNEFVEECKVDDHLKCRSCGKEFPHCRADDPWSLWQHLNSMAHNEDPKHPDEETLDRWAAAWPDEHGRVKKKPKSKRKTFENDRPSDPMGPCATPGCDFQRTWHQSHCCKKCSTNEGHGDFCHAIQQEDEAPDVPSYIQRSMASTESVEARNQTSNGTRWPMKRQRATRTSASPKAP
jgi:hypothetical protein